MAILSFLAYKTFNISLNQAVFSIYPGIGTTLSNNIILLYILYFALPCIILSQLIKNSLWLQSKTDNNKNDDAINTWKRYTFSSLIIIAFIVFSLIKTSDSKNKNLILADYYNYNEQWDKVVDVVLSEESHNPYLNFYYNRAINHSDHFVDMFFNYPQIMSVVGIFPDYINTNNIAMISSDFYFDLGYISQAHHWAHEAQTANMYSPRILKRLVQTNLILRNYNAANKFLILLNQGFYNTEFVKEYQAYLNDTNIAASCPMIADKRLRLPKSKVVSGSIKERFIDLINANNRNKNAYEHLEIYFLLTYQLDSFVKYFPEASRFYSTLPAPYEEAMLIYSSMNNLSLNNKVKISKATQNKFTEFNRVFEKYGYNKQIAEPLIAKTYGNSYLYYALFTEPTITNEVLERYKKIK